ncbi:SIMPL domain-containing protein [Alkalihalobacillus sp. LMS39]|uniref:SIMPL domain-containing protein n=1 Tax=Alkalihalobacillus sp. LMS39 TaxID=2924032 RepID=UPI001FB395B5|nr:SIMPL domain-containing protein [Alkalihalobacillus sp. LMS39]UOE92609.1 SIMPL domain-containing protein [Alkalihalobacillus sp. LMS39]
MLKHENAVRDNKTVTVIGRGIVNVYPDVLNITIGIVTRAETSAQALEENVVVMNRVRSQLEQIGVTSEQIETDSFRINPVYDYTEGLSQIRGFEVEHLINVTFSNVEQGGLIYEAAVAAGANIARGLQFSVAEPELVYKQALELAMSNAREKAEVLLSHLPVSLSLIPVEIKEQPPHPMSVTELRSDFVLSTNTSMAPPIEPKEFTIEANVTVIYSYSGVQ